MPVSRPRTTRTSLGPGDLAARLEAAPALPPGADERFAGYGVMGLPFRSGHYLALRRFPATSIGPAYTAVWWRDPADHWTIWSTAAPEQSCARYFGRALQTAEVRPIALTWTDPHALAVAIPDLLEWQITLSATPASQLLSTIGGAAPRWLWRNPLALRATALTASAMLGLGSVCLEGRVPNGQHFVANPRRVWLVTASQAMIHGQNAGPTGPLSRQAHLADFWLPQRGLFAMGESFYEPFDAGRHGGPGGSFAPPK